MTPQSLLRYNNVNIRQGILFQILKGTVLLKIKFFYVLPSQIQRQGIIVPMTQLILPAQVTMSSP